MSACPRHLLRAAVPLFALSASIAAQWQSLPTLPPVPALRFAAVATGPGERLFLFGGQTVTGTVSELWRFTGAEWQQPGAPPVGARRQAALAFDSLRGELVLFGGTDANQALLGDTWVFDGAAWTQRLPPQSPSPRSGAAMAFDQRRQRTVLFGGNPGTPVADTWEWNGIDWLQRAPAQQPPNYAALAMVYDAARQEVGLLGAATGVDDYWVYSGDSWQHPAQSSPQLAVPLLAYDAARARVVAFTGAQGQTQTWEWDGRAWFRRQPVLAPPAISAPDAVLGFDP